MQTTNIYTLSHPVTGEVRYVGKANDVGKRFIQHVKRAKYLPRKTVKEKWIGSLLDAGRRPIIEKIDTVLFSEWEFWERHYISLYKSWGFKLTNGTEGGDGSKGLKFSEDAKKNLSEKRKGRKLSDHHKEMIRQSLLGKKLSEERKRKISESHIGKTHTIESKKKVSESLIGNTRTKGYKHSEGTKLKMSNSHKRRSKCSA